MAIRDTHVTPSTLRISLTQLLFGWSIIDDWIVDGYHSLLHSLHTIPTKMYMKNTLFVLDRCLPQNVIDI